MSNIEKIRLFASYTAACWPVRFDLNKFKVVIFVSTA